MISGGRIIRITIDPHIGGATVVEGGRPTFILASGYLGSTLLGGLFVLAGYSTLVAKVMSFVLGIGLIVPLALVRDKLRAPASFQLYSPSLTSQQDNTTDSNL